MAVYTPLAEDEIRAFLDAYALGGLSGFEGIAEGVENSNFLLHVEDARYILTLFEKRARLEDLPYFLHLMEHLAARGVSCPRPVTQKNGRMLAALKEKPAVLVTFLEGRGASPIRPEHLPQLGALAARMHLAAQDFPHSRANDLSLMGWQELARKIGARAEEISPGLTEEIRTELDFLFDHWPDALPCGPVHADLFPDNVFFRRERGGDVLSGVIDFYFACNDFWAYDLAIIINAWCFDARGRFAPDRVSALMQAYTDIRPLAPEEEAAMQVLLRGAAMRFLLTRAHDWVFHPEGALVTRKDPLEYLEKLRFFQAWKG